MKKYQRFLSENFQFLEVKFSIYLNRRVFKVFGKAFWLKYFPGVFTYFYYSYARRSPEFEFGACTKV